jgi:hypothetical protein
VRDTAIAGYTSVRLNNPKKSRSRGDSLPDGTRAGKGTGSLGTGSGRRRFLWPDAGIEALEPVPVTSIAWIGGNSLAASSDCEACSLAITKRSYGRSDRRSYGTKVVSVTDPLRKGLKVKYTKGAAIAAGTLMAMGFCSPAIADSGAQGASTNSPGIISGNTAQVPIHIPINVCGNSINVVGLLNPSTGNSCQAG